MHYETTTTLAPERAIDAAAHFFGKEFAAGPAHHDVEAIRYTGGGGHVTVRVAGVWPTTLAIETHAWDQAVRSFVAQLPR